MTLWEAIHCNTWNHNFSIRHNFYLSKQDVKHFMLFYFSRFSFSLVFVFVCFFFRKCSRCKVCIHLSFTQIVYGDKFLYLYAKNVHGECVTVMKGTSRVNCPQRAEKRGEDELHIKSAFILIWLMGLHASRCHLFAFILRSIYTR